MHLTLSKKSDLTNKNLTLINEILKKTNTLILIHATWCSYCVTFKSTWKKFTQKLNKNNNLDTIDIENTVLEEIKIIDNKLYKKLTKNALYFPLIMLYNNKSKSIIYEGDRTISDIIKFTDKHCSIPKSKTGGSIMKSKKNGIHFTSIDNDLNKLLSY